MFHDIPERMSKRMRFLEDVDARDRTDGTPHVERLRQIPSETGRFLAILAAGVPAGAMIEIGASAGYSAMWIALACMATNRTLTTFEVSPAKTVLAAETFAVAGITHVVDLVEGDARDHLPSVGAVAFCFLDADKDLYADCYEAVIPKLVPGGLLVADNAINHRETLQPMLERALDDSRVDAVIVPIGKGELVCRKR